MKFQFRQATFLFVLILVLTVLAIIPDISRAQSQGILISPQRVILEGRNRTARVTMVNPGNQPRRFQIALVHMEMDSKGRLNRVLNPTPDQKRIEQMLRFSPRRTFLGPGESQTIRLMARRPPGLPDGEYRVHLSLSPIALPRPGKTGKVESARPKTNLNIDFLIGITLPVFIRYGELKAVLTPSHLEFVAGNIPFVNLSLSRTGNRSLSTDIHVFISSPNGNEIKAGTLSGVAVYTPLLLRTVKIPLILPPGFNPMGSKVKAVLQNHENKKTSCLSTNVISLPSPSG